MIVKTKTRRVASLSEYVDDATTIGVAVEIDFAGAAEAYGTGDAREERVVYAHADVFARHYFGAALANDDLARRDFLPIGTLDAEVLRV